MRASKSHLHAEPPLLDLTSVAHAVWGAVCIANKPFSLQKLAKTAIRAVTVASISITVGTVNYQDLNHRTGKIDACTRIQPCAVLRPVLLLDLTAAAKLILIRDVPKRIIACHLN